MNKEDNKTLESISNHLMQAAAKFNDKELTDAAKKFTDLIKSKLSKEDNHNNGKKGNRSKSGYVIKSTAINELVEAIDKFANSDKNDSHSLLSFVIDGHEEASLARGNYDALSSLVAQTMHDDKELRHLIFLAVLKYRVSL